MALGALAGLGAGLAAGGTALAGTLAATGIGIGAVGALTGAAIGGQIDAGRAASSAARQQAQTQNDYTDRAYEYDTQLYQMQKEKILADREQAVKVIQTKADNENKKADWVDLTNLQQYAAEVQIRQREQDSLDAQYAKSTDIYNRQISLNELSARTAVEDEFKSVEQVKAEQRYNQQEEYVKFLELEGEMRARMGAGRTAAKGSQAKYFRLGETMSAINAALDGVQEGMLSKIQEITMDRTAADIAAEAQRMLDPGTLPAVPQPFAQPRSTFLYPRTVGDYDFGPEPIRGVYMSPSAAANQVWGNTIGGIAGTVGSLAMGLL